MTEEEFVRSANHAKSNLLLAYFLHTKLFLASFFHDYAEARKLATELEKYKNERFAITKVILQALHAGLVHSTFGRRGLRIARKHLAVLQSVAEINPRAAQHMVLLLEAVIESSASGILADDKFQQSIDWARRESLWAEEGLAYEHWARFHSNGRREASLQKAMVAYGRWGAVAKVARIAKEVDASPSSRSSSSSLLQTVNWSGSSPVDQRMPFVRQGLYW